MLVINFVQGLITCPTLHLCKVGLVLVFQRSPYSVPWASTGEHLLQASGLSDIIRACQHISFEVAGRLKNTYFQRRVREMLNDLDTATQGPTQLRSCLQPMEPEKGPFEEDWNLERASSWVPRKQCGNEPGNHNPFPLTGPLGYWHGHPAGRLSTGKDSGVVPRFTYC